MQSYSMKALFDLTGRKVMVTGGGMGIGRGYALALAGAGADVAIVDIKEKNASNTVEEIKSLGRDSLFVKCDVTNEEQVTSMIGEVVERFGKLDIGVNNAGIGILGADETMSKENWDRVIALDLTAVFLCAQAEARQMIKQEPMGGKIINTASMSATIANANASYNSAKAGVVHMTHTLAAEWAKYNIYVNCISPSYVLTELLAAVPVSVRDRMREFHPLGWLERPEDLYGPIIFLASDASNYITGHDLIVDGGHMLNVWLAPIPRVAPPSISRGEETVHLKHDLEVDGVAFDEDGYTPSVHPEVGSLFMRQFGNQLSGQDQSAHG
jgi:sorbose reductase